MRINTDQLGIKSHLLSASTTTRCKPMGREVGIMIIKVCIVIQNHKNHVTLQVYQIPLENPVYVPEVVN